MDSDIPCNDFLRFSKLLHTWRKSDDRINNELNAALPTASFAKSVDATKQCASFFAELSRLHKERFAAIKQCISSSSKRISDMKSQLETSPDSPDNEKIPVALRKEQLQLRQFQSELLDEEIIQNSALKVLYERCRDHYNNPAFDRFK
uniref:Protein MIX23 n=1 Tax=Schistocephalus solidus TaxID=70667 RepID=A0A0X3PXJ0_SCHSO